MPIELVDTGLTIRNGNLHVNGDKEVLGVVPAKQQKYLQGLNNMIAEMTLAEGALTEEIAELEAEIAASKAGQRLRMLKSNLKEVRGMRSETAVKQRGVVESFLEAQRPGTKLSDIITAAMASTAEPKKLTNGKTRK